MSLADRFLKQIEDPSTVANVPEDTLNRALAALIAEAKEAWPQVTQDDHAFVHYLGERMPQTADLLSTLDQLFTTDLYLCAATVAGDEGALRAFSEKYRPAVYNAAKRVEKQGIQADDTAQELMEYLLLPRGERAAALALYSAQGPLLAYVRVSSLRKALRLLKKEEKLPQSGGLDRIMELADTGDDPELTILKDKYRGEFKEAFHQALQALESSERNLLRYHYMTELNTRQIGKLLGLHQSNVVRRLTQVRAGLLDQTRSLLMENLGLGASKFQSIMLLVQSQLDVSIERMLESKDPKKP